MDYLTLVQDNTRYSDDYINASKWCAAFGKRFDHYSSNAETRKRWKAIAERVPPNSGEVQLRKSTAGKAGIWIHPLCAIDLAMWLSPEFAAYVIETFKRYLDGDITLADEVLQRSTKEDAQWLAERAQGKVARVEFAEELKRRNCSKLGYAKNTNAVYVGLFGQTAATLKNELEVKNPRDGMTKAQLAAVRLVELLAVDKFHEDKAYGDKQTTASTLKVSKTIGEAIDSL